jgi:DNA polymerase-3 subunit delta
MLEKPPRDCRIVVEAGDLKKNSPLRTLFEKASTAVAMPCYLDNAAAITALIDEEMRAAKLTLSPDARTALASLLGGDRLASRGELRKLATYCMGRERVELDDVRAVVADASDQALDSVIDAVFAGKTATMDTEFGKARAGGSSPAAIVSAAIRQVASLHKMRLAVDGGDSIEFAMSRAGPPVHFSRHDAVGAALRAWTSPRLLRAMDQLAGASLDIRQNSALGEAIAQRTLLSLAMSARRRDA